jgi:hypothetical protein
MQGNPARPLNAATQSRLLFQKRVRSAANSRIVAGRHQYHPFALRNGVSKNTGHPEFRAPPSAEQRHLRSNMTPNKKAWKSKRPGNKKAWK